ncbi:aminotransferase class IV [Clostridium sp. PL3]|uniref:Aminotransferase class IV n=1 Tax=Clostridium thailandense TaxID=2794346 RepID=A0A949WR48_9CLOT|nr:aminotransferase class IV [Clostridium thailandense]MBV7273546.1 aminotransferase class IV [Clostridium thailandense]
MIILNGEIADGESAFLDQGLYFGRGLFETILVKNKPLFIEEHLNRINAGLKVIGINRKVQEDDIINAVSKLKCMDCVLKLVVTEKNIIFTVRKNNYTKEQYEKGFKVKISSVKRNQYSRLTYLKSLNYLENILEHDKCITEGYNEVLFFNVENNLSEGSVSNVYFIKNNKIYTPSIECGLLNGTVRKFIINNFEVVEGKFNKDTLMNADGIFLTNSVMGVMKVSTLCDKKLDDNVIIENIKEYYENYIKENY